MDFNLEEKVKDGINFKGVFRSLILYSVSLFIAFWWADFTKEVMAKLLPVGENIIFKSFIGVVMTIALVVFAWLLVKGDKNAKGKISS